MTICRRIVMIPIHLYHLIIAYLVLLITGVNICHRCQTISICQNVQLLHTFEENSCSIVVVFRVSIIDVSGLLLMLGQHTSHVFFFPLFLSDVDITNILVIDHMQQNFTHVFD